MPKLRKLKYKQHGGVKVSLLDPATGNYVATVVDLDIIRAIFENCMDMYLISASSASGTVFGATLPQPVGPAPGVAPIILRSNQINEDGSFRSQDEVADRERHKHKGMIILGCGLKISFILKPLSDPAKVEVATYSKRVCIERDLKKEADVQSEIFQSTLCGTSAPLTFTPDKIAATTMTAVNFSAIVEALALRALGPSADPRVARALTILREIGTKAKARRLDIHIFVMDLLKGETLRTILEKSVVLVSQQQKINACNNVAIAVIMTFLKSLYWSRDQHADNAMISGANTFTLDFGLMYHLVLNEVRVKSLLNNLLTSASIRLEDVCKYFGVVTVSGMTRDAARAEVRRIFNALYDMLRDPNLKTLMVINTAADNAAEINRISEIVFQMLSFFALVDGLSNRYIYGTFYFQSSEYMELVFTEPALRSFEDFLHVCRINLSTFVALAKSGNTVGNMAYIVQGLQPALALCPWGGQARDPLTVRYDAQSLGPFSTSPGQILYDQRIAAEALELAEQQAKARLASERMAEEAARKKERAAAAAARNARSKPPLPPKASRRPHADDDLDDEEPQGSRVDRRPSKLPKEAAAPPPQVAAAAAEEAARKNESDAAAAAAAQSARSSKPPKAEEAAANSRRRRSRSKSPKADEMVVNAAAAPETAHIGRLARFTNAVTDWFDRRRGGTVKRRFRVQKRQKQTMRPCNIRRQRRTHAIRRRRNKNKTH